MQISEGLQYVDESLEKAITPGTGPFAYIGVGGKRLIIILGDGKHETYELTRLD